MQNRACLEGTLLYCTVFDSTVLASSKVLFMLCMPPLLQLLGDGAPLQPQQGNGEGPFHGKGTLFHEVSSPSDELDRPSPLFRERINSLPVKYGREMLFKLELLLEMIPCQRSKCTCLSL